MLYMVTFIYHQYTPNVSIYAIHGSYGLSCCQFSHKIALPPRNVIRRAGFQDIVLGSALVDWSTPATRDSENIDQLQHVPQWMGIQGDSRVQARSCIIYCILYTSVILYLLVSKLLMCQWLEHTRETRAASPKQHEKQGSKHVKCGSPRCMFLFTMLNMFYSIKHHKTACCIAIIYNNYPLVNIQKAILKPWPSRNSGWTPFS